MCISEVYNEDCMVGMSRYPDKFFELAIVDPPYGIDINKDLSRTDEAFLAKGFISFKYKKWDRNTPGVEYFNELFRVSKEQIIWGGNYFPLPPTRCFLVWDKKFRGNKFADCELAWTSFKTSCRVFEFAGILANKGKMHPTQKPINLYKWLLHNYAKQGDKIIDTHLGSGSSRIACYEGGFDFYGWEIDKDYFEAQEKRFQTYKSQLKLAFV